MLTIITATEKYTTQLDVDRIFVSHTAGATKMNDWFDLMLSIHVYKLWSNGNG